LNNFATQEKIKRMSYALKRTKNLPASIAQVLPELGDQPCLAHRRRGLLIRARADEVDVSVPTVMSMERGKASASIGVYAAALSFYGRLEWLLDLMAPDFDWDAMHIKLVGIRPRPAHRLDAAFGR
jgi:hypothetical protein